jgi:hypothetical protein
MRLVCGLKVDFNQPKSGLKLMELDPCKWFDEDVRKLVHSVDLVDLETSLFPVTPDEVVLDSEVLGSLMKDGILYQHLSG